jgi:hypothetical protein
MKETSKNNITAQLGIGDVRCSACVFYQERGKSTGNCNKHLKTFYHSKTGKWVMSMNINVRSFWKCDDFLHCT